MTRRDRVAVPGVAAAGAQPGRAEEAAWGRAALLHFFGGEQTCPERDATRGMCRFDLQPQDTLQCASIRLVKPQCHGTPRSVG